MIPRADARRILDAFVSYADGLAEDVTWPDAIRRFLETNGEVLRGKESVEQKGRRLLQEGRLTVEVADGVKVVASCRGDSAEVYRLGFDPRDTSWRCTCPARGRCSHLAALQLVTVRPPQSTDQRGGKP